MKKKVLLLAFFAVFGLIVSTTLTSCKTKEGCGLEEKYGPATNKEGRLSTKKRGKSNLFSKKQRKKMKKRGQ